MQIVIINGKAGTGKDTFVLMCKDILGATKVLNASTIDFVKEVAEYCGWDGTKTQKNPPRTPAGRNADAPGCRKH